jgi:hypothetical protein
MRLRRTLSSEPAAAARHTDDAIVDFDYAVNFLDCLFGFGTHGSVATRACKGHFAVGDRYRDAIGRHNQADVLGER